MFEFFIGNKYHKAKKRLSFINVINKISVVGIAIGVATLIVVLSVFNGFREISTALMTEGEPHLIIQTTNDSEDISNFLKSSEFVDLFYKFEEGKVLFGNKEHFEIINLILIEDSIFRSKQLIYNKLSEYDTIFYDGNLAISFYSAIEMNLQVRDSVQITSFESLENSVLTFSIPEITTTQIRNIYFSRNASLYKNYIFASSNLASEIFPNRNRNTQSIAIFLLNLEIANEFKTQLSANFPDAIVKTWNDNHAQILNVMKIESFFAYLLLSLIIAVAAFNILTSLTMSVQIKKKDIAILRSFGVSRKGIRNIFLFEGLLNGIKGTSWGFLLGLAIYFVQKYFQVYKLDSSKYILDAMPVSISFWDLPAIVLMSVFLSFASSYYPAKKASLTNIIESIKWE